MKKSHLNLLVDVILFLQLAAMVGIGLLIQYVLVPGRRRLDLYGPGTELSFWGWDRHQWGALHYWIGLAFLALIVLHVVLHWGMVKTIAARMIPNRRARWAAALILLLLGIALVAFPVMVEPRIERNGRGAGRGNGGGSGWGRRRGWPQEAPGRYVPAQHSPSQIPDRVRE